MSLFDNPTQTIGLAVFLLTFICCALHRQNKVWRSLAVIFLLLFCELAIEARHGVRLLVNNLMQYADIYGSRGWLQALLVLILLIGTAIFLKNVVYQRLMVRSNRRQKFAVTATSMLALLFASELISVHAIDAIFYHSVAGVMVIGWLWLLLSGFTSFLAVLDRVIPDLTDHKEVADK